MKYFLVIIAIIMIAAFNACEKPGDLKQPDFLTTGFISPSEIALSVINDSAPADDKTYIKIVVKLGANVIARHKELSFEITPIGKFNNGSTTIKLPIDVQGEVYVYANSSVEGIAYIKATTGDISVTGVTKFYAPAGKAVDTLSLSVSRDSVPANNYSYAEVLAEVKNTQLLTQTKTVRFITDKGTFSNDSKEYNLILGLDGKAKAYLKHNRSELIRVTATVGSQYSKELNIQFITSLPEQVFIEPGSASLPAKADSKIMIRAKLARNYGSVSEGQIVQFYDSTDNGQSAGIFLNTTRSNSTAEATTEYWLQDTTYRGYVYIKGYVTTNPGRITGLSRILIK